MEKCVRMSSSSCETFFFISNEQIESIDDPNKTLTAADSPKTHDRMSTGSKELLQSDYDADGNTETETKSVSSIKSNGSNPELRYFQFFFFIFYFPFFFSIIVCRKYYLCFALEVKWKSVSTLKPLNRFYVNKCACLLYVYTLLLHAPNWFFLFFWPNISCIRIFVVVHFNIFHRTKLTRAENEKKNNTTSTIATKQTKNNQTSTISSSVEIELIQFYMFGIFIFSLTAHRFTAPFRLHSFVCTLCAWCFLIIFCSVCFVIQF